jgi:hypothetical protein
MWRTLAIAFVLSGCGSPATVMPEFTGCGTDEHWQTFDNDEPTAVVGDAQGPVLTQPDVSTTIPFMPKPVLMWSQDPNDPGMRTGDVPFMNGVGGCNDCCPEFSMGALTTLHDPPVSGDVYDLQFFDGGTLTYRVVTTLQEWTAPDDIWASWRGKTLTLKIYRMTLLSNDLKAGPFVASHPTTLVIGS